jgi:acyl phosphate:glycerol-3-phosphate acyltransferase
MLTAAGWLLASYLLGAIPTSYLVSRGIARIDLRQRGSGNLGATNLYRVLGWRYAVPVALFDIAKGAVPVLVFAPQVQATGLAPLPIALACGVAAILGHVFSIFVGFRGGKGVATAAGVMLGLAPLAVGVAALVWAVILLLTGYVSLASITAAVVLPFAVYLLDNSPSPPLLWVSLGVAAGVVVLHRQNIQRLLKGTENRFGRRAPSTPRS